MTRRDGAYGPPGVDDRAAFGQDVPEREKQDAHVSPGPRGLLASDCFLKPSFTFEQIRTFLAVASREHVTLAARTLQLSQAAVTQQVQLLERALGVRLLRRVGRNVRLTEEGLEVAGACLLVMRSLENLERIARSMRGLEAGSMSVGASQVAASRYLSRALTTYASKHPAINVQIVVASTREICDDVAAGEIECGVVDAPLPRTQLEQVTVAVDEVAVVARPDHPLAGTQRLVSGSLQALPYLLWEPDSATELVAAELIGAGYAGLAKVRLAGLEAVREALLTGLGFATVPTEYVADHLRRGELVSIGKAPRRRAICAVRRPGAASAAAEAFWEVLTTTVEPAGAR